MWPHLVETLGRIAESVLAPIHGLIEPLGGSWAWGWAVIVVGAAWRVLTWPLLVAAVADRLSWQRQVNAGCDPQPPERSPGHLRVRRLFTCVQVVGLVLIAVWSRTGPSAKEAGFAGLDPLASSPVSSGAAGVAWALGLAAVATAGALVAQRIVPVTQARQVFFARYLVPAIFCGLGLFLPAAIVLPFVVSMTINLVVTLSLTAAVRAPEAVAT